jgi:hypothetical protein
MINLFVKRICSSISLQSSFIQNNSWFVNIPKIFIAIAEKIKIKNSQWIPYTTCVHHSIHIRIIERCFCEKTVADGVIISTTFMRYIFMRYIYFDALKKFSNAIVIKPIVVWNLKLYSQCTF